MTYIRRTPPTSGITQHLHLFEADPGRWEAEHACALRTGHVRDHTCAAECEPVLVYERTRWGWLAWTIPGDGSRPELPHQIAVLTPSATPIQRLALRWLTRRPARRIGLAPGIPGSLRFTAVAVAFSTLIVGLFAMADGIPADVALPAIVLAPLLAERLPDQVDARAREHVRSVEGDGACRYLQRLAALHTTLAQAAAGSDRYELRRSAEIGHNLLWDAAGLLQTQDTRSASAGLIVRERLMLQLADQVAHILKHAPAQAEPDHTSQAPAAQPGANLRRRDHRRPAPRRPGLPAAVARHDAASLDEALADATRKRSSTAAAARSVTQALTYRALVECAGCGAPATAPGEDLCPACPGWPPCRTCPGPTRKRAHPDSDGRCTTCAGA